MIESKWGFAAYLASREFGRINPMYRDTKQFRVNTWHEVAGTSVTHRIQVYLKQYSPIANRGWLARRWYGVGP